MSKKDEALLLAEFCDGNVIYHSVAAELRRLHAENERLKALAQPEQGPVAWGIIASNTGEIAEVDLDAEYVANFHPKHIVPLYTAPPSVDRSEMRDLTDEEIDKIRESFGFRMLGFFEFARAINAAMKEKK